MTTNLSIPPPAGLNYSEPVLIGYGAEAEVYRSLFLPVNRVVAIKVLRPVGGSEEQQARLRARFRKEAEILWETTHQNLVRIYEIMDVQWRGHATVAYSMEWLEGSLADLVNDRKSPLPAPELERHLRDVLSGLGALHGKGVAVRDLRPQNLLLSPDGTLKLADLGMARTEDFAGSLIDQSSQFQAPEVLSGAVREGYGREDPPVSAYYAADLYAVGLIFYQAAVGPDRWAGLDALSGVHQNRGRGASLDMNQRWRDWHLSESELPALETACPQLPLDLCRALDGMVRKDRAQRLGRVADVLAMLDGAGARAWQTAVAAEPAASVKEPEHGHQPSWWTRHGRTVRRTAAATVGVLALTAALVTGARLLRSRTAELTVTPDGIAGLTVRWGDESVAARAGTQVFRLQPAAGGRLAVLRQGEVLCDTTLNVVAGVPRTLDVGWHLPGQLTVLVNVPADITVEGQPAQRETREGRYELKPGRYRYTVSAAGYTARDDVVEVLGNSRPELSVTLEALPAAPVTGTVVVTVEPAGLSAPWELRGPGGYARGGAGSMVLEGRAAGSYSLTWSAVDGCRRPNPVTQSRTLAGGGEVEFRGVYRSVRVQPPVDPAPDGTTDPAAGTLREWTISGAKFAFRWIPAGRATIGSPPDEPCRDDDETQFTAVITRGYWMQETEVTQAQWAAVMGSNPSSFQNCPDCPVETVSWDDAQRFLQKLTAPGRGRFRLPTEVEWEYAARAGNTGPFGLPCPDYNSDNCTGAVPCLTAIAWYFENSDRRTHPVGLKRPNRWNLYDMSGNVWEWVADRYGPYPSGAVEDYAGPRYGDQGRVLRGGSWSYNAYCTRVAYRFRFGAGSRYGSFGFRCVRDRD